MNTPNGSTAYPAAQAHRLWGLQALRGLAATLVVIAHGIDSAQVINGSKPWLAYGNLENIGAIGVDIFFVISGFIITTTLSRNPAQQARTFSLQRLIRVLPLYYLLSLPWIGYGLATHGMYPSKLFSTVFLWPAMPDGMREPYLGIGWTLCFEMLFYATVWLTLWLQRPVSLVLVIFIPLIGAQLLLDLPLLRFVGNPIILEFLFGVVLALNHERLRRWPKPFRHHCIGAAAILWLALLIANGFGDISEAQFTLDGSLSLQRAVLFGTPALLITALFVASPAGPGTSVERTLSFFGDISYSIYLIHPTVIAVIEYLALRTGLAIDGDLWILIVVSLACLAGAAVHLLLERPLTRTLRRHFSI